MPCRPPAASALGSLGSISGGRPDGGLGSPPAKQGSAPRPTPLTPTPAVPPGRVPAGPAVSAVPGATTGVENVGLAPAAPTAGADVFPLVPGWAAGACALLAGRARELGGGIRARARPGGIGTKGTEGSGRSTGSGCGAMVGCGEVPSRARRRPAGRLLLAGACVADAVAAPLIACSTACNRASSDTGAAAAPSRPLRAPLVRLSSRPAPSANCSKC